MVEEDRLANLGVNLVHLLFVEDVAKLLTQLLGIVAREFNRRERQLTDHHVVVDGLIEVPTLVGFQNHREVVAIPCAIVPSL